MRKMIFSALAAVSVIAMWTPSTPAQARDYRYCLQGRQQGYPGDCSFDTFAQCKASASGRNADCGINPRFAFARQGRQRPYSRY